MAKTPTDITLYTTQTPNGIKASIALAELGLDYKLHPIKMSENEQKEPWYLEINPNGRIPALTDKFTDGEQIRIFESGAILQYLVDRYDTEHKISYPKNSREHWEVTSWLMWQQGGLGPMQGQANHFKRYAPEEIPYGINRYINETRRLYRTVEDHLKKTGSSYLVGEKCTIADIATWGWVTICKWSGVDIEEFPVLKAWVLRCKEREGFEQGRHVPEPHKAFDQWTKSEEELKEASKGQGAWIQKGMQADAKKN